MWKENRTLLLIVIGVLVVLVGGSLTELGLYLGGDHTTACSNGWEGVQPGQEGVDRGLPRRPTVLDAGRILVSSDR